VTTVLVGNGPSALARKCGSQIDAFDRVVRFNKFRIKGYEEYVGTRMDLWFTFWQYLEGRINWEQSFPQPETLVVWDMYRPPFEQQCQKFPRLLLPNVRLISVEDAWKVDSFYHKEGYSSPVPSTGLVAVILLRPCTIVGFDHFKAAVHHYWPDSDLLAATYPHRRDFEQEIIERFIAAGEVIRL
jgi:hypothetical protein